MKKTLLLFLVMIGFVGAWNWTLAQEETKFEAMTLTIAKNEDGSITFNTGGVIEAFDVLSITKSADLSLGETTTASMMFIETDEINTTGPNGESINTIRAFAIPEDMIESFQNMSEEEKEEYISNNSFPAIKMSMMATPIELNGEDTSITFEFADELNDAVKVDIEE